LYKNGIDEAAAELLLRRDVAEAEKAMRRPVAVPLTQKQHDALVSFTFNIGQGELKKSKFLSLLNEGAYNAAAEELSEWKYVSVKRGGTDVKIISPWQVERREAERKMFLGLE
jgi:lysozyme